MNKIFRPAMTPIHQKKLRTTWYSPTKTFDYQITPEIFWIWTVLFYTINQSMIHSFHSLNQSVDNLFDWFMIFCFANIFVQDLDNIMYNFHWCRSYGYFLIWEVIHCEEISNLQVWAMCYVFFALCLFLLLDLASQISITKCW